MPELVWELIILGQRIYEMIVRRNESDAIKQDARDQLDVAIDAALARERLRIRQREKATAEARKQ